MARRPVSLLSMVILSSVVPSRFLHSDALSKVVVAKVRTMTIRPVGQKAAMHPVMTSGRASISVKTEGMLLGADVDGSRRAQQSDAIAQEFDVRVHNIRRACDLQLEEQKALHRVELAEQRVELLKGMVPQAAHEAVVTSYEKASAAALKDVADSSAAMISAFAGDFSKREEALYVRLAERDASLEKATSDLRKMAETLACLKQSVGFLRSALRSHVSQAEKAHQATAFEIRKNEAEPQRRRALAAERDLSELRQAAHGWLAMAHTKKLEAIADARSSGFAEGKTRGRKEATLESEEEICSLKLELDNVRQALSEQRSRSHQERLILREDTAYARDEAVGMIAAVGSAGLVALHKAREVWLARGRAEGFAAGVAEGKAVGREEGVAIGRTDFVREMRMKTKETNDADVKERTKDVVVRPGAAFGETMAAASTDAAKSLLAVSSMSPTPADASALTISVKI